MDDRPISESGIGDFNRDLEANIKRLERLSKAADAASGSVSGLSDTYNTLAQLAEGKINFKVSGLKSLKFLIDIDDAKFNRLNKNLEQLDNISKKFNIEFNISGLKDFDKLQDIDVKKIKDSLKSLEELAKEFQSIDVNSTINVSDDLIKGLSRLDRISRFNADNVVTSLKNIKTASGELEDINVTNAINVSDDLIKGLSRLERLSKFDTASLVETLKNLKSASDEFEDINIDAVINVSDDLVKGLSRLERLSRFDTASLVETFKNIKDASKDFEDINIDSVINVSDDLVKGLSRLERLSRFDVSKLNNTIKELQEVASNPINIDMNINIDKDELDKIREINALLKNYKLIDKINNDTDKKSKSDNNEGSSFLKIVKSFSDELGKGTANKALLNYKSLGAIITKTGTACGAFGAILALLSKVTIDARRNTSDYVRSLQIMGNELSDLDKRNIETSNKINKLSNKLENFTLGLGSLFTPILDFVVDLADVATPFLNSNETPSKIAGVEGEISANAKQEGFSTGSANVLASNTYNAALKLAGERGEQASDIARKLGDAWRSGSDAAKEYGVVLNDNVLTGYLLSEGIDIVNVEITDAMKQYYRYQLMLKQVSGEVNQSMIKDWTSLGFIIDKTKGKLFSFDEVIQLTAADPTIPEIADTLDNNDIDKKITDASSGGLPGAVDNLNNTTDNLSNASDNLSNATDNLNEASDNIVSAGDTIKEASDNMLGSADKVLSASDNFKNASDALVVDFSIIYDYIIKGADYLSNSINDSVENARTVLNRTTAKNQTVLNNSTSRGLTVLNNSTSTGLNKIIEITNYSINSISNAGRSWITQIQQVGQQILSKMASYQARASIGGTIAGTLGLGQHWNIGTNIANDVRTNLGKVNNSSTSSFAKVGQSASGVARGVATGTAKGFAANASAFIDSPTDLIKETADLFTSLKNEKTGEYEWGKLPAGVLNMIYSSLANPLMAISTGFSKGYNRTKEGTNSIILGGLGGLANAATNAIGYTILEDFGDYVNVAELSQDSLIGLYNQLTGNKIQSNEDLSAFSKEVDKLLNDLINGTENSSAWSWVKTDTPRLADGGIGTHEIHNATLFENNKREAVIPLETDAGIGYLADAMSKAGSNNNGAFGDIVVNITLSGLNVANNDAEWERVGRKIGEIIDVQRQRRGDLNYGSSF